MGVALGAVSWFPSVQTYIEGATTTVVCIQWVERFSTGTSWLRHAVALSERTVCSTYYYCCIVQLILQLTFPWVKWKAWSLPVFRLPFAFDTYSCFPSSFYYVFASFSMIHLECPSFRLQVNFIGSSCWALSECEQIKRVWCFKVWIPWGGSWPDSSDFMK